MPNKLVKSLNKQNKYTISYEEYKTITESDWTKWASAYKVTETEIKDIILQNYSYLMASGDSNVVRQKLGLLCKKKFTKLGSILYG